MNAGDTFEIIVKPYGDPKRYRLNVELIYATDQLLKFKISGGNKSFEMHKLIVRKSNQWKVQPGSFNFVMNKGPHETAAGIIVIQDALDAWIKKNTNK